MKKKTLFIIKHIIKGIIYFVLFSVLSVRYNIAMGITPLLQHLYGAIICICLGTFGASYFRKYRKIAYIIFASSLTIFILMNRYIPEIKEQHLIEMCLDGGMVYDPIQKICRTDCWKWDDKLGCLKEDSFPEN